ncbi:hypothetical protein ACHQM5_014132 [Ranunculus cassubicifolius]
MAVFVRSKRVTDPLNDKVKACLLCGRSQQFSSSGSEHDGEEDNYDSPCFSNLLIHGGFLQQEDDMNNDASYTDSSDNQYLEDQQCSRVSESEATIKSLLNHRPCQSALLFSHLSIAVEKFAFLKLNKSVYMRHIMYFLRELGHNAGICKTKWDSTGALTAGSYEFIDVVRSDSSTFKERCIIDVDFAGEFIVARPTKEYERLLKNLPGIYLGRSEELKQIIRVMSDAAKKSLKSKDLHLPPWRKNRYMQLKWFAPYRRTTNPVPTTSSTATVISCPIPTGFTANCRSVGFNTVNVR